MTAGPVRRPTVRIAAGRWKGRRLESPAGSRPTSGRARQALFDVLRDRVRGAHVLDLYAGSGAVGLEAVSRGAARAVLVESEDAPLRRTLSRLDASADEVELRRGDIRRRIEEMIRDGERFDLVFADPPYGTPLGRGAMGRVAELLSRGGLVVLQLDANAEPPELAGLRGAGRRGYGRNVFYFFDTP